MPSTSTVTEEQEYYVSKWAQRGLQYASIAATPVYLVQSIRKGSFTFRQLARYNWTLPVVGAAAGAGYGALQSSQQPADAVRAETLRMRRDRVSVRRDDLHLIGSAVGALLLPALLLRRVGLINGLLGGAGLGGSVGLGVHLYETQYGRLDRPPSTDVAQRRDELEAGARGAVDDVRRAAGEVADRAEGALEQARDKVAAAKKQ